MPQPVPNPAPAVRLADRAALANMACTTVVEEGLQFLPGKLEKVPARGSAPAQVAIATFQIASKVGSVYLADIFCKRGQLALYLPMHSFGQKQGWESQRQASSRLPILSQREAGLDIR